MPYRSKAETDILVTAGAALFATYTRDAKEIANLLNTSERSVHRWAERDKWEEVLQTLNYEGERNFRVKSSRDTESEAGEIFKKAREVYQEALRAGEPKHKLATIAGKAVGLPSRKIHDWAVRHGWRDE